MSGDGLAGGEKVVPAINRIAEKFENVVLTQDWHPEDHRRQSRDLDGCPFDCRICQYPVRVDQARRGWLEADDVINRLPLARLKKFSKR
jgi:nicotinamidase-related amidase